MYVCVHIFTHRRTLAGLPSFAVRRRCLHWPSAEARSQGEINYPVLQRNGSLADPKRERKRLRERERERPGRTASDTILSDFIADLQLPENSGAALAFEQVGISRGNRP